MGRTRKGARGAVPHATRPRRQISEERRLLYYLGMALMAVGLLLFVSNFFLGPRVGGPDDPEVGDPDFWEQAQEKHEAFGQGMRTSMTRAIVGMGLMVLGGILMRIGARGAAGSGLVLDPKRARRDLEPWSRMGGGVVEDAISEVDLAQKLARGFGEAPPAQEPDVEVKVRCRSCRFLCDEEAKFCRECGAAL